MTKIKHYGLSFVGRRKNNEDAILQFKVDDNTWCFAVADGMGGAEAGEVASSEVIEQVKATLKTIFPSETSDAPDLKKIARKIFDDAQNKIAEIVEKQPELDGMGTTLTLLLIHNDRYVWGNVGDSRIYLAQGGSIKQITNDHSYIEQFKKEHNTEVPESIANQYGNIITRAISGNEDKADVFPEDKLFEVLQKGDIFLLCSDGLITSKIADSGAIFLPYLFSYKKLKTAAEQLIARAFNDGADDNISVVIALNGEKPPVKVKKPAKLAFPPQYDNSAENVSHSGNKKSGNLFRSPLKILALILVIALLALGYRYLTNSSGSNIKHKGTTKEVVKKTKKINLYTEQIQAADKSTQAIYSKLNTVNYNINDLKRLRTESLIGLSKLLVTFLNAPAVKKAHEKQPLTYLIKALYEDKPNHLKSISYIETGYDSANKIVMDTNNPFYQLIIADTLSKEYPYFIGTKHLLLNKAGENQYVIISYGNLGKITSRDYKRNMPVFARESGLKSLTILLANIYIEYYHPSNLKKDLSPLLHYLVVYNNGKSVSVYGKPVVKGFEDKARTTRAFYIQGLTRKDNKECIDICVPIPDKNRQVLRAGYLIN